MNVIERLPKLPLRAWLLIAAVAAIVLGGGRLVLGGGVL